MPIIRAGVGVGVPLHSIMPLYMFIFLCLCLFLLFSHILVADFSRGTIRLRTTYVMSYTYYYSQCQISPKKNSPNFFSGRKAIARRSSSAARPMRTAAARIAPLDPQLLLCKREATEQTV